MTVKVKADAAAAVGERDVTVGTAKGGSLAVYKDIAGVKVVPELSIPRIGGRWWLHAQGPGQLRRRGRGKGADGKPF
ncbi:MAG: hypothetical protein QM805_23830 [Pseudomonas sp.]